jgi:hypothetical protein
VIPLVSRILADPRLNGSTSLLADLARRVDASILRSAIARAPLRLVNERLARKEDDGERECSGDRAGG